VLTLQKTDGVAIVSVPTSGKPVEDLLNKEWLLTNNRGSYTSSTIIGCNTRRYHGLLIGSLHPPADRIMALANCMEMLIFNHDGQDGPQNGNTNRIFNLSTFEFSDKFAPSGYGFIRRFRQDTGVHFDYRLEAPQAGMELTKSIYLLPDDEDVVAVVYDFTTVQRPADFVLRPFVGLRDFHTLQKSYAPLCAAWIDDGLLVRHDTPDSCELLLKCSSMSFEKDQQWWFNFVYRNDKQRCQDFTEDLWTPGFFKCRIEKPVRIVFRANLGQCEKKTQYNIEAVRKALRRHQDTIVAAAKTEDERLKILCLAADQFISKRQTVHASAEAKNSNGERTTILAGFPWFADWGRDVFIALPGLLLLTGRFDDAKSVLTTFAAAVDEGMIPNRFDDHSDTAYFNSIDASLWFVNAAFQYLNTTGDTETFIQQLLPAILCIIDSYYNGTRFDIHADTDGLITAGNEETQLTWMDAKYEGVAFTPRCGKAVEINALWYNSLCHLAGFYSERDIKAAKHYHSMADKVEAGFCKLFWNESKGYLNDCILPDGSVDASLRPNQIFAVSLPFSPLSSHQARCVVNVVQSKLLTPFGLRTLSTDDSRYKGIYAGPLRQRDEAYHQGTVWPYLIGPFVESYLKVNDFSPQSKEQAGEFIEPLMHHLTEDGCLGQICEIFDGDAPHKPRGCIAQAWSIAELIRAYLLING